MKLSNTFKALLPLAFALSSVSAESATWRTCNDLKQTWEKDWTNMYISTVSMPEGSTWDLQAQYMMSEWNNTPGSNFKFYVGRDTNGSTNTSNGKNEIDFKNKPNETYLGVAQSRYECYWFFGTERGYIESDIHLNTRYSWTTGKFDGTNFGSPYNYELVMLHELGHSLGLLHEDDRLATMNSFYPNSGSVGHYNNVTPHADDRHGLRLLYPDSSTGNDVIASRFRNLGASSSINRVREEGDDDIWRTVTTLYRGDWYDVEYTFENLGSNTETVPVKFYISTNNYISSYDRYIGSTTWTMPQGSRVESMKSFIVPTDLSPGTYYIGYVVDPDNNISESSESNNFVSLRHAINIK